jgi:rhamnosyltransferase
MSLQQTPQSASVCKSQNPSESAIARVLVLLAAYNGSEWICAQIKSILSQAQVITSILINDDGSSDETRLLIESTFANDSRVKILSPSQPSGSAGQNFFFLIRSTTASDFDYVAFSDQDDIWFPNKLADSIDLLKRHHAVAGSSATLALWPDGSKRIISLSRPQTQNDYLFEGAGQGCTFLLTSSFYNRVQEFVIAHRGLTDRVHFHDWTIYALARSWGQLWIFDPRPSMLYRQHASNDTGARASIRGIISRLSSIRNGWYSRQLSLIAAICDAAAPDNLHVKRLCRLLNAPPSLFRKLSLFSFCRAGGRRRRTDNLVLLVACLLGWI